MKHATVAAAIFTAAVLATASVHAKEKSVSGTWTLAVEQHVGLKLELTQRRNAVIGAFEWPHGDAVSLTGVLKGDALTFAGDSGGENFSLHIESTGTLKADGTMAGTLNVHFVDFNDAHEVIRTFDQKIPWTAVRADQGIVQLTP